MRKGQQVRMNINKQVNRRVIVSVMMAGAFVTILNQTLLLNAIPPIMSEFHIEPSLGQWLTTVFLLTNGVLIPISAFLIDRYTTRALLFTALSIFIFGTMIGAVAPNFEILLLARVIQAGGAGIMMPLMQTVMLSIYPPEKRGSAMGMFGLVIAFAPAIGPTLSGFVVDNFTWRYLFYIIVPIASLVLLLSIRYMKNVTSKRETRIDTPSILTSTLGWGGLLYGFSIAGTMGWSHPTVLISLGVGTVSLMIFIRRQLGLQIPMLEFRVFQSRMFVIATFLTVIVFMLMIGTNTILPIYAQDVRSFSALESGLMLLPSAIAMGIMNPIAGRLFDRFGGRGMAITGFACIMLGQGLLISIGMETSLLFVALMVIFLTTGIALVMTPLTTAGINSLPHELIAHGTAMINTIRMVGGSIGTAILISIMSSRADRADELAMLDGMHTAFFVGLALAIIGFASAFTVRSRPIRPKPSKSFQV